MTLKTKDSNTIRNNLSRTPFTMGNDLCISGHTRQSLCAKEFAQSFAMWRRNIRLVLSLQLLSSNKSIQEIAIELGYASDSAYIYAFKKMFNQTPSKYRTDSLERGLTLSHHSN
ncbi:helix-turn-helix domain-containing protein [Vibrio neptunius]|uniref:Helix-turn-helix domain-containing protein n=1 Tax=Vibrio neptunius TaxID=170651 RepID=A0ABS2ZZQ6_9VIBR|nr:helix-turn-helix domain-containing protein [Vibrio neptunius]MBN3514946.1 helix-turn-helix domain-containing protein [Vibrio neptunius]MBN3548794.1 helix-turn-helix domain-containing protein [Vibrio neptunius]MBN3577074.1 helix-turn-helix domain-containing protein [Vibrio neptunius]MCH9870738.1 helix-turn-helix domain-containing protein [Vibrio neptunius]